MPNRLKITSSRQGGVLFSVIYADKALVDGAMAMAWTCIDMAATDDLRDRLIARG